MYGFLQLNALMKVCKLDRTTTIAHYFNLYLAVVAVLYFIIFRVYIVECTMYSICSYIYPT